MSDLMNNNENTSSSIPVMQEKVDVGKKIIEKGRVKISKIVKDESEVLSLPTTSEQVHIRRIPVNKIVERVPGSIRYEGDTMIIPVLQEVTATF